MSSSGYAAPTITTAGIDTSGANYQFCRNDLLAIFQSIYGQNTYLGVDSAPYQMISAFSAKWNDLLNLLKGVFNAQSPNTAIGTHLDSITKLLGIARALGGNSQAPCLVTGTPGQPLTGIVMRDATGLLWDLPDVTIGGSGTVNSVLTCETAGPVAAAINTITAITNPQAGLTSVTNTAAANLGKSVETDSQYRGRATISTALPSLTMIGSVAAAVAAVPGVTRSQPYENPSGAPDSNGLPAHSLSVVTEGGDPAAIAMAIYLKHGIGPDTYGTTSVTVTDPTTGGTFTVNFFEVAYTPIYVTANVKGFTGYSGALLVQIQQAISTYLQSLAIGETVTLSGIIAAAMALAGNITQPLFSISSVLIGTAPSPSTNTDIAIAFNHVSQGILGNVTLTQL